MVAMTAAMMMCLTADAKTEDVGGRVIDMQGEPLPFVSVALLASDSTYIQGATSDVDGYFQIMTTDACCILRFSYIGYRTKYVDVRSSEIGTIQMEQDQTMLNEIVVKGQMPKTKLTGNSMITTIQGTILGQSGTAKEMLAKVPGMTLKGEDLEVLGKGTPVFYINGRKMRDKDELKRLRSEEIQSVEVITNPGAEYDATISAVVRIKTVRREGAGFGFDLMAANNQDLAFGFSDPSSTLNLRYRHNNLDLFGMVNYWSWDSPNDLHITQSTFLRADEGIRNILQDSHMRNDWHGEGLNYNLGFNWQINDKHSLGARVERHDQFKTHNDMWVDTENNLTGRDLSHQGGHTYYPYNWQGNAYYNGQVKHTYHDCSIYGDKGYIGADVQLDLFETAHIRLECPYRLNQKDWKPTFIPFAKARKRIETIFSQLTDQFLVIRNYAKITNGLFARIIGKISALTILQYVNFINDKPIGRIKYALN